MTDKEKDIAADKVVSLLDKMPFTEKMFNVITEATKGLFEDMCNGYGCTFEEFKEVAREKLSESNMSMGCCFHAWNFCKDSFEKEGKRYENIRILMEEMILAAAISYVNCQGKDCEPQKFDIFGKQIP